MWRGRELFKKRRRKRRVVSRGPPSPRVPRFSLRIIERTDDNRHRLDGRRCRQSLGKNVFEAFERRAQTFRARLSMRVQRRQGGLRVEIIQTIISPVGDIIPGLPWNVNYPRAN